eukprot:TRINITY_DN2560_c0_g1_i1.p1 TRINITY_DN2560_c0_g1~~TRINITY_DN2560_c0_g1_i1.p1  ORF type:complete len:316 (+),score=23.82 TRINITY_DN2560_c0_g1_i1:46-948(+)
MTCMICFEAQAQDHFVICEGITSKALKPHATCRACLVQYLSFEVMNKMGAKCVCAEPACRRVFSDSELEQHLTPELFSKYDRFRKVQENPNWRECPKCASLILADPKQSTEVTCTCEHKFCFHHGDAHLGRGCPVRWENPLSLLRSAAWRFIHTRSCPSCGTSIEKNGGCPHMTCRKCTHQWCWYCKAPTTGGCSHLRLKILGGAILGPIVVPIGLAVVATGAVLALAGGTIYAVVYGAYRLVDKLSGSRLSTYIHKKRHGSPRSGTALSPAQISRVSGFGRNRDAPPDEYYTMETPAHL